MSKQVWQDRGVELQRLLVEPVDLFEYPDKFFSDYRSKYCLYLRRIVQTASGWHREINKYVSVLQVKAGETYSVLRSSVDSWGFCTDSSRPRAISAPASRVAEVKTALTAAIMPFVKQVFPEFILA